jgi:hypothetical protein
VAAFGNANPDTFLTIVAGLLNTPPLINSPSAFGTCRRPARRSPVATPSLTPSGTPPGTRRNTLGGTGTGVTARR